MIEAGAQGLIGKEDLNRMAGAMAHALNGVVMEGFETPQGGILSHPEQCGRGAVDPD